MYFGHQSVGRDILAGVRDIAPELRIASLDNVDSMQGGCLLESSVGANGDPASKNLDFLRAVKKLHPGDFALLKYCYVDMTAETSPAKLYSAYSATLDSASALGVRAIAVTMPITALEPAWKRLAKRVLRRSTELELNAKRQVFNDLLREHFGPDSLFDLARSESTRPDGSRSTHDLLGAQIETLPREFTDDGAHLNGLGRRHVAAGFLAALTELLDSEATH